MNSGEKWLILLKSCEKLEKVGNGEKLVNVGKSGESGSKLEKVGKSGEK